MSIVTTIACQQAQSAQDHVVKTEKAITVFDGHGHDDVIDACREMDPVLFEQEPNNYITTLEQKISRVDSSGCGATFAGVRTFLDSSGQTMIDLYWIGDSYIGVYDDEGNLLFKTNTAKKIDPRIEVNYVSDELNMSVRGEKDIGLEIDHYWHFPKGETMNMTESLGHQNVAYLGMHHHQLPLTDSLKIILATDGFWDMTYDGDLSFLADPDNQADELLQFVVDRWSQEWNYDPNPPGEDKFSLQQSQIPLDQWDDIAIGVIQLTSA